jgi:hypothetical protein
MKCVGEDTVRDAEEEKKKKPDQDMPCDPIGEKPALMGKMHVGWRSCWLTDRDGRAMLMTAAAVAQADLACGHAQGCHVPSPKIIHQFVRDVVSNPHILPIVVVCLNSIDQLPDRCDQLRSLPKV